MNTNLESCPKCGHSVRDVAAACDYCGAAVSAGAAPSLPTGEKTSEEAAPYPEQAPPMQPEDLLPDITGPEEPANTLALDVRRLETDDSEPYPEQAPPMQSEDPLPDITDPEEPANTPAAVVGRFETDDSDPPPAVSSPEQMFEPISEPAPLKTEHERAIEISDRSQVIKSDQEVSLKFPESRVDTQQVATEALEQERITGHTPEPEAEAADFSDNALQENEDQVGTETAAEKRRRSPEPDVLESGGTEPSELATPEPEGSESTEFESPSATDALPLFDEAVAEAQTDRVQDAPPAEAEEPTAEPAAVTEHKAAEEDILLNLEEIVQLPAKNAPDSVGDLAGEVAETETGASPTAEKSDILPSQDKVEIETEAIPKKTIAQSAATVLKIENAYQEMAEAVKKQKAALAETRAAKKQKLMRARAQALKRKEETLTRAQALKKQKEAKAGIKILKKENTAQPVSKTKNRHGMIIQGLQAHTKMQALLNKYANQVIGINYDNSVDIKEAELVAVNDEFFSVFVKHNALQYSYPLNTILTVIEGRDGVGSTDPEKKEKFIAVIKVFPLVLS